MLNFALILETAARERPGHTAIIFGERRITYAELDAWASQVANGLVTQGLRPGDKVAFSCPTNPYFLACYFGILKMGGVTVPLNFLMKPHETARQLAHCDAVAYLAYEGTPELPIGEAGWAAFQQVDACRRFWLIPAREDTPPRLAGCPTWSELTAGQPAEFDTARTRGEDTCSISYTSGTSGQPKGSEWTHASFLFSSIVLRDAAGMHPGDTVSLALPAFHSYAQSGVMNPAICGGATLVLHERFDAGAVWRGMAEHAATVFAGVPSMYWEMWRSPVLESLDPARLRKHWRVGFTAGAPLSRDLLDGFQDRFGVRILDFYGMAEARPVAVNRVNLPGKPGSAGPAAWGNEVRILDDQGNELPRGACGEVAVRGPLVMKGYYNSPETNARAFRGTWLLTGDIGRLDEDGYLFLVDRKKDVIIRGGTNVYPGEVEEVLLRHPAVAEAAVIGVPDERLGEEVKACVVLAGDACLAEAELVAWARASMAAYAYPRIVEFLAELPRGTAGKILKDELRKRHTGATPRGSGRAG